jgi:hypothetical protein
MLFSIISHKFTQFDEDQQTKFIVYLKNWLNKLMIKDSRKNIAQLNEKIIIIINLLTSNSVLERNKTYFEDNILINLFSLLSINEELKYNIQDLSKLVLI